MSNRFGVFLENSYTGHLCWVLGGRIASGSCIGHSLSFWIVGDLVGQRYGFVHRWSVGRGQVVSH